MSDFYSKSLIFAINLLLTGLPAFPQNMPAQSTTKLSSDSSVHIMDTRADFTGWHGAGKSDLPSNEIRIGFFMPPDINRATKDAADMAINDLNRSGGYNGLPFRLVNRWAVNPWSAGSKEMIRLIYQDSVCAVIGSINGTATHIAEQVVTKARVVLIAPFSSDPTLNYINIPWMFRLPPDNKVQAQTIIEQGVLEQGIRHVGLITANDHDGKVFVEDMLDVMASNDISPQFHFELPPVTTDPEEISQRIGQYQADALIICLSESDLKRFLPVLDQKFAEISVFIPWLPQLDVGEMTDRINLSVYYIEPISPNSSGDSINFNRRFREQYDYEPNSAAAYIYDAISLTGNAVRKSGLNRARIRDSIAEISDYTGASGRIKWDNGGGNQALPVLRRLEPK